MYLRSDSTRGKLSRKGNSMSLSGQVALTATRRRGAALEHAIFEATLAELSESGYNGLAIDRVARRAQLGRASIYRRWPTKRDLVADAIAYSLPASGTTTRTGSVRTDLLTCFQDMHRMLDGPAAHLRPGIGGGAPRPGRQPPDQPGA